MWADDFMGGNGDPADNYAVASGPFRKGRWILRFAGPHLRRDFGNRRAPTLPRTDQVLAAFLIDQYDDDPWSPDSDITRSFRNYLEGWHHPSGEPEMHNRVHAWIGGSMLLMSSPNEPAFFPLHANLDRIWGQWQDTYGFAYEPIKGARPGHNLRDEMQPFGVTPEDVLDYRALGYRYDTDP
jgi:tyrosinase